jgi:hypothetical protein
MAIFLLWAIIAWVVITVVTLTDRRIRRTTGGRKTIEIFNFGGKAKLVARSDFIRALIDIAIILLAVPLALMVVYEIAMPGNTLYGFFDFVAGRRFGQIMLGIVFGAMLSTWMMRLYRRGRKDELSLSQKLEGVALLFIFVLGTTTITIDELARGFSLGSNGVQFQIPASGPAAADAAAGNTQSAQIIEPIDRSGDTRVEKTSSQWGMGILTGLGEIIKRDLETIGQEAPTVLAASLSYSQNVAPIVTCVSNLVNTTGDEVYLQELIDTVKQRVQELHVVSLGLRAGGLDIERKSTELKTVKDELGTLLAEFHQKAVGHGDRLRDGLRPLRVSGNLEPASDFDCRGEVKNGRYPPRLYSDSIASEGFSARPYVAIVYAALLQLEDKELAAIDVLKDWKSVNDIALRSQLASVKEDEIPLLTRARDWHDIRIYSSMFTIFETMFRRNPNQPQVILDAYLAVADDFIDMVGNWLRNDAQYDRMFFRPASNLTAVDFELDKRPEGPCTFEGDPNAIRLGYLLVNAKVIFARRAIDHPEFAERFLPKARAYVDEAVNSNPACLERIFPLERVAVIRAESLYVHARFMTAQAIARKPIGSTYQDASRRDLTTADNALRLALAITDDTAIGGSDEATGSKRFAGIVDSSARQQLRDQLNALKKAGGRTLERLR